MKLALCFRLLVALVASAGATHAQTTLISYLPYPLGTPLANPSNSATLFNNGAETLISQSFTTGTSGAILTSATLQVETFNLPGPSNVNFTAYLFANSAGAPVGTGSGGLLATSNVYNYTSLTSSGTFTNAVFTFATLPTLAANTTYDLVLGATGTPTAMLATWNGAQTQYFVLPGWSIPDVLGGYTSSDSGASWSFNSAVGPQTVILMGTPIPEPSTYAAIFGGLAFGVAIWRRTKRDRRALA